MSLLRREPLGGMISLRDAMDWLLGDRPAWSLSTMAEIAPGMLSIDMIDKEDVIVVKANVPGVKPEELEVTIVGNTLAIKGEIKEETEDKKGNYVYQERCCGSFCRTMTLPAEIKADAVKAEFENGILTLTMPKAEAAKRTSIKIKAK